MGDAQAIANLPSIKATAPIITGTAQLNYGANNWSTSCHGRHTGLFRGARLAGGKRRLIHEADLRSGPVVILGR